MSATGLKGILKFSSFPEGKGLDRAVSNCPHFPRGMNALGLGQTLHSHSSAPNYSCPLPFTPPGHHHSRNQDTLIDLAELDAPGSSTPVLAPTPPSGIPILPPPPQASVPGRSGSSSQAEAPPGPNTSNALSLLDEELLCLGVSLRKAARAASGTSAGRAWQGKVACVVPGCLARRGRLPL